MGGGGGGDGNAKGIRKEGDHVLYTVQMFHHEAMWKGEELGAVTCRKSIGL